MPGWISAWSTLPAQPARRTCRCASRAVAERRRVRIEKFGALTVRLFQAQELPQRAYVGAIELVTDGPPCGPCLDNSSANYVVNRSGFRVDLVRRTEQTGSIHFLRKL